MLNGMNLNVKTLVDKNQIKQLAIQEGKKKVDKIADKIEQDSLAECPVDQGDLKSSYYRKNTKNGVEQGYSADHAEYVDSLPQSKLNSGTAHFLSGQLSKIRIGGGNNV